MEQRGLVASALAPPPRGPRFKSLSRQKLCNLDLNCDLTRLNLMYNLELAFQWLIPLPLWD